MKEISTHFAIVPYDAIQYDLYFRNGASIPLSAREYSCRSKVTLTQNCSVTEGGTLWTISFRAVTADCDVQRHDGKRAVIAVIFMDGSVSLIGSMYGAPLIHVTPSGGNYVIECSLDSPSPIEM